MAFCWALNAVALSALQNIFVIFCTMCVGIFFSCIGIKFYCAAGKPLIIFNQNGHIMSPEYKVVHTEWLEAKVWPI
jgi:hypothetical protein